MNTDRTVPEYIRHQLGDGTLSRAQLYDLIVYHLRDRQWDSYPNFEWEPAGPPPSPDRTLMIVLSSIGDVTTVLPAIHSFAQKWPGTDLEFLCEEACAVSVLGHPDLSECHQFPHEQWNDQLSRGDAEQVRRELRSRLNKLKKRRYDYVINLHWTPLSALITSFLSPDRVNGLEIDDRLQPRIVGNPIRWYKYRTMAGDEGVSIPVNAASFKRLSVNAAGVGPTRFYKRRESSDVQAIKRQYRQKTADDKAHILVNTGSRMKPRRWPATHCARVLEQLDDRKDVEFGLIGGPEDVGRLEQIEAEVSNDVRVVPWFRHTESLLEDVYLSDCADVILSTDSGPLHLISIRGNRVLDVAGDIWVGPWNRDSLVVRGEQGEIEQIPVAAVRSGVEHLLEGGRLPPGNGVDWFVSHGSADDFWFYFQPMDRMSKNRYCSWISGLLSLVLWSKEAGKYGWDDLPGGTTAVGRVIEKRPEADEYDVTWSDLEMVGESDLSSPVRNRAPDLLKEWDLG